MIQTTIQQPQQRFSILRFLAISAGIVFLAITLFYLLAMQFSESYFAPYPAIDTYFTSAYSEEGFQQIKIGDNIGRVLELVGPPYGGCCRSTRSTWEYSSDGAFCCFDFAWLDRRLNFNEEGLVSEIISEVEHD